MGGPVNWRRWVYLLEPRSPPPTTRPFKASHSFLQSLITPSWRLFLYSMEPKCAVAKLARRGAPRKWTKHPAALHTALHTWQAPLLPLTIAFCQHDEGKEVEAVSISYNGRLLATGGRDGKVIISKIPSLPKEGSTIADVGHEESVRVTVDAKRKRRNFLAAIHIPAHSPNTQYSFLSEPLCHAAGASTDQDSGEMALAAGGSSRPKAKGSDRGDSSGERGRKLFLASPLKRREYFDGGGRKHGRPRATAMGLLCTLYQSTAARVSAQ